MTADGFRLIGAEKALYKSTPQGELHLHVFRPERQHAPAPAIVFFFGGGWARGEPMQFGPQCRHLCARGMVAVSAEYRVLERHGTPPQACIADGRSAVRWLRQHAADWGIDASRIAAGGGSAGGHVAASTAFLDATFDDPADDGGVSCRPDALVLFNPVLDTTTEGWGGGSRLGDDTARHAGSPSHHIAAGAPPTVIFHGKADESVSVRDAQRFAERMHACGNRCDLHLYDGAGHGFYNPHTSRGQPWHRDTLAKADAFLTSLGWLAPAPADAEVAP